MYKINKVRSLPVIDFAAEELKKYLRMMMPRCGEIEIEYAPDAQTGFRIGLMIDFGLDMSEAEDPALDDIIYIETDGSGGIIAGSNPCALLIAVYRYLRFCGCRWLFPGIDGEWIPIVEALPPISYSKKADHRYRGQCNEGAEFQQCMIDAIDFTPKIGMNTFMLEFDIPSQYYQKYYTHADNRIREPEPVNNETILQWKRQCEVEIKKRGLHFHDMGHGWTAEPFGLHSNGSWAAIDDDSVPETTRQYLAQLSGKRGLFKGVPLNTNVCLSNPDARRHIIDAVAQYSETQNNVDFLHIWLADATNNHCECEQCRRKTVADWYLILLNEIDEELTRRNLNQHLVFIVYSDTFWPPLEETLHNKKRFTMLYAPISRRYTESYDAEARMESIVPFHRNENTSPKGMSECLAYLHEWQKTWPGDCFCYEYHFWLHQYYEPTGLYIAKLIHRDICGLKKHKLMGIVEDGSQRSFFPTGFAFYVYGETLFDTKSSFEELQKDYFIHAFGPEWHKVLKYLCELSECLPYRFLSGRFSRGADGSWYDPLQAKEAAKVKGLAESFAEVIRANKDQPHRASSVAWRLLDAHRLFVTGIAEVVEKRALGDDTGAYEAQERLMHELSVREEGLEHWFDLYMFYAAYSFSRLFVNPQPLT